MKILNNVTIGAFLLGALIAAASIGYIAKTQIDTINNKNKPIVYSDAVQWVINNPEYAEVLKVNHDQHVQAAENAFIDSLTIEGKE